MLEVDRKITAHGELLEEIRYYKKAKTQKYILKNIFQIGLLLGQYEIGRPISILTKFQFT
jgi:hypothetical protein